MSLAMAMLPLGSAFALVFLALFLILRANSRLAAIQRQQAEEFAWLRRAVEELRRTSAGVSDGGQVDDLPRIGAPERVLQVGDHVEVIDGLHRGEYGTIVPPPAWLPAGVVSVELAGREGARHMEVSRLLRVGEAGQK